MKKLTLKSNLAGLLFVAGVALISPIHVASAAIRIVAMPGAALSQPVFAQPEPGSDVVRYWVVEKTGKLRRFTPGSMDAPTLLDVSTIPGFTTSGEQGLLGMAFDPDFATNHFTYFYESSSNASTKGGQASQLVRYTFDPQGMRMTPATRKVLFRIDQEEFSNHKGGMIVFGPDRHLYVGTGDGGSGGDPNNNSQNKAKLLGKMLRFQVTNGELSIPATNPFVKTPGARGEIWAYGLRNPWRFSFDRATGQLWCADVGQNLYEEIDIVTRGGNYGWRLKEGNNDYDNPTRLTPPDYVAPIFTYGRALGQSISGGYVYRGGQIAELRGRYVFGDYGSSKVWALDNGVTTDLGRIQGVVSFAETPDGELIAISVMGKLYQLLP